MNGRGRMLALVGDAWGGRGGIAQYNRDLLGALAGAASGSGDPGRIEVFPRHAPDPVAPPRGVVQHRARPGRLGYAAGALTAALSGPVGLVFCGHLYMAPLASFIARLKRAPLVLQTHGVEAWPRPSTMQRRAVEASDLVLAVSRYTRAKLLDWAALEPERVRVLPNTVGEAFTPGDASSLRRAWGLDGRRVLLSVGRMSAAERYKGQDRVIAAIPGLGVDVVYLILGEGDDRPRLEALAAAREVTDRVRFVGTADRDTLVQAYRMADLFVMASTGEGFGIAFLEAMACGTPAFGLAAAGAVDALGDGELGLMGSPEDDLAAVLAEALARPPCERSRLADAVRSRFGRAAFAQRARAIFQMVDA